MKKIYLLLLVCLFAAIATSFAQVTVSGSTGANGTYTSLTRLTGAFSAINAAGSQAGNNILITITADIATEDGASSLNASTWTTILITPVGARTVSGASSAGTPLINFFGADNVTIDGLNSGGNSLTISNTTVSALAFTCTFRFIADATNNTITRCSIKGSSTSTLATAAATIVFSTGTTTGNDNNTISSCDIGPAGANLPSKAIFSSGSTAALSNGNSGILINNNNIFDFFLANNSTTGMNIITGNDNWTISNNRIYQTATRTFTTTALRYAGITINQATANPLGSFTVSGNTIGFGASNGTGTTTITGSSNEFRGLDLAAMDYIVASSVQGNVISGINQTSSRASTALASSCFTAIALGTSNFGFFNVGTVTPNVIGSLDGSSTIVINETSVTANTTPVLGIYDVSLSNDIISNNKIGAITIQGAGTVVGFRGIYFNAVAGLYATITDNIVGGSVAAGAITDNQVGSYSMYGIQVVTADGTLTGNTIRNFAGNSTVAGSVIMSGISKTGTSTGTSLISQNTIHSFSNNSGVTSNSIYGMDITFPATANVVERNSVHSLSITSTATGCQLYGIIARSPGTAIYRNNMVRLGFNAAGTAITTGFSIIGIRDVVGGANSYYHNSVYIGGSGVISASNSYAFLSDVVTSTRNFQNNVFWNARGNSVGGGVSHLAIRVGGTTQYPAGLTSNYNVLYASGTDGAIGVFNGIVYATLANWRTITGQDMISINADPQFISPAGDASTGDIHLKPSPIVTVCEGNGLTGINVTNDFDGQTRSSLTPVDIGADAGSFTGTDLIGPEISYIALSNSSCLATGSTLSATITDISGVNTTVGTKPRLYYKKSTDANNYVGNTSVDNGWKYVEASNSLSPFSFTIDYTIINGGSVVVGDVIQYFVTAQDLVAIPNVSINSGIYAPALMPATVALTTTAFPLAGTIKSYTLSVPGLASSVTIGAAGTYTSLTGAGGLFAAINVGGINANITATIIDAAVVESGANALTQMSYGCGGPFTLTIVPAATGTVLTGTVNNNALIQIKSSNVIIDGSSNGTTSKDLTITNIGVTAPNVVLIGSTGTTPVINTTVKNCYLINGLNTSSAVVVSDGTTLGNAGYFNNISLQNNSVQKAYVGIFVNAVAASGNGSGFNISSNSLNTSGVNAVRNVGIYMQGVDGGTISGNDVGNFESITGEIDMGIWLATGTQNIAIEKNTIHDIQYTGVSGYAGKGIVISTGQPVANITVKNNMIYGITGDGDSYTAYGAYYCPVGIYEFGSGQGGVNIYYNSIYLSGNTINFSSDAYSLGIALDNNSSATIKDNIVLNQLGLLTLGVGAVGIAAQTSASQFTSLDYNDYYSSASLGLNLIGKIGTTNYSTLATWRTATGQEANSLNVLPNFTSSTDLHLVSGSNCGLDGYGTPIAGITTDYDAQTRDAAAPDMGADEFTATYSGTLAGIAGSAVCENKNVSVAGTTYATNACSLIARILPSGGSPVSGKINTCVTLDATQQYFNAEPYVKRHFDISPVTSPTTATSTLTLYFTDAEFVNYNTLNPLWPKLPTSVLGNGDANRANVRITQFHGTATTTPSQPGMYTGPGYAYITPGAANVFWNGTYWEVTFSNTGFSGFYLHTSIHNSPLAVSVNYFRGTRQGTNHLLDWKVACNSTPSVTMTLERSASSSSGFTGINTISATAARCNQPFSYTDAQPLSGMNYYRLKMVDADGKISYSGIVALLNAVKGFEIMNIAPNPVTGGSFKLNVASAQTTKMSVVISDMMGRVVSSQTISLINGYNSTLINVSNLASGTYNIYGTTADDRSRVIRFVKQ